MPKTRQIASAAGFTDIVATIPLHYLKVWPDQDRNVVSMQYKLPDDNFATQYETDVSIGDVIERIGPGRHGLLGIPAAFSASGQAATVLMKIKFSDSSVKNINIYESETNL